MEQKQRTINQTPPHRWRVETLQFGYNDIKYAATRRQARDIRAAALKSPHTDKVRIVDMYKAKAQGNRRQLTTRSSK